jgi:hypothetical protein
MNPNTTIIKIAILLIIPIVSACLVMFAEVPSISSSKTILNNGDQAELSVGNHTKIILGSDLRGFVLSSVFLDKKLRMSFGVDVNGNLSIIVYNDQGNISNQFIDPNGSGIPQFKIVTNNSDHTEAMYRLTGVQWSDKKKNEATRQP